MTLEQIEQDIVSLISDVGHGYETHITNEQANSRIAKIVDDIKVLMEEEFERGYHVDMVTLDGYDEKSFEAGKLLGIHMAEGCDAR